MWLIFLLFASYLSDGCLEDQKSFLDLFAINSNVKKCCPEGQIVLNQEGRFQCANNWRQLWHFITGESLEDFGRKCILGESCVDHVHFSEGIEHPLKLTCKSTLASNLSLPIENYMVMELTPQVLPKCCPPKHEYDPKGHTCVQTNREQIIIENYLISNRNFYMKLPLIDCILAIDDFFINENQLVNFNASDFSFMVNEIRFSYGQYCFDKVFNANEYVIRGCLENTNGCRTMEKGGKRCIRKCCPQGHAYVGSSTCSSGFFPLRFNQTDSVINPYENFVEMQGTTCKKYPVFSSFGNFSLDEMGQLHTQINDKFDTLTPFEQGYCYEHVQLDDINDTILFLCFRNNDYERPQVLTAKYTVSLSCIFLILTLMGYTLLKKHNNLHGKILMSHCATLLIAFSILAYLQLSPYVNEEKICKVLGYSLVFTFMGAFSWLNVMCFDIWWTCGSMRVQEMQDKAKERKKYLCYTLYAFFIPTLVTSVTFLFQHYAEQFPKSWSKFIPNLGVYNCFYEQKHNLEAYVIFFLFPAGIIFACNLFLFIRTVTYCYRVKNEIERMKDTNVSKKEKKRMFNANREKLNMAFKLFLVMGIPWFIELVSAIVLPSESTKGVLVFVEIVLDLVNSLQGVFIFCIFLLKSTFLQEIKNKLPFRRFRRTSQVTSSYAVSST